MKGPVQSKAKPKATPKTKQASSNKGSDQGSRMVVTKRYSQRFLEDVPICHMRQWLNHMDSVYANINVTKKFGKEDCLQMLSFCLGFHPREAPVELLGPI